MATSTGSVGSTGGTAGNSSGLINFSGLGSGIDTASIIQQLLAIDKKPETLMKTQITNLQQREAAYNTVSAQLLSLQSSAYSVNALRSFDLVAAASTDQTVATVTAQTGAQTGTHSITVNNLAAAQTVSSAAQSSQTAPLNVSGQILINGKVINVQASDSLTTLVQNINAASPGVTASIIAPASNQFYLTLSSNNTGVQGQASISDVGSGTVLSGLGFFGAGTGLRHPLTSPSGAGSDLFTDSATGVATLEGLTSVPPPTTVTIGGGSVSIDLSKSLSGIASDINAAGISGVTAQVVSATDPISKATKQQLQISGATSLGDNNNALASLGLAQKNYGAGRVLVQAQDASFTIDNLAATRPTNTVSDVVSGVTFNLLKAGAGATTNISVTQDTSTIKTNITTFVKAFNSVVDTISNSSQYDSNTGSTGILFGDSTVQGIVDSLVSNASGSIPGLPLNISLLSQAGITLDQSNHLNVDDAALTTALTTNLKGVAQLFRANGTPTDASVQFVSATGDTKPAPSSGYSVTVTQPATQATIQGASALPALLAQDETLTFGGPLFGTIVDSTLTGGHSILLRAGSAPADIASQINGDPILGPQLSASIDVNGKLTLASKSYGSLADFAVVSAISSPGSSGIGTTVIEKQGKDVAGSINGEVATGVGQFLTGSQHGSGSIPNGNALGLQLRITATSAGSYGTVAYTSGVANIISNYITAETDPYSGALTTAVQNLDTNVKDIQGNITTLETSLKSEEDRLNQQFAAMESAVTSLKSTQSSLTALTSSATTG